MSDVRPAFPAWRVRLDPLLAAQEKNAVYEAFRLRRRVHWRAWWKKGGRLRLRGVSPVQAALSAVGIVVGVVMILFLGCIGILAAAALVGVAQAVFFRHRVKGQFLPVRMSDVLSGNGFFEQAALDVWMTGATGRDVLEAVYLETAEAKGRGVTAVVVGLGMLVIGLVAWHGNPRSVLGVLMMASMAYATWECVVLCWCTGMGGMGAYEVERRVLLWESRSAVGEAIGRGLIKAMAAAGILLVAGAPIVLLLIGLVQWSEPLLRSDVDWVRFVGRRRFELSFIVLLIASGLLMRGVRGWFRRRNMARVEKAYAQGGLGYNVMMAGTVMGDVEGEAWARWWDYQARIQGTQAPPAASIAKNGGS